MPCTQSPMPCVCASGAVGDGVTDDTAAIQAAIDDAASGGELRFESSATYRVDGTLRLPSGLHVRCSGATIIKTSSAQPVLFVNAHPATGKGYGSGGHAISISGATFRGSMGGTRRVGVTLAFHHVDGLRIHDVVWDGAIAGSHAVDLMGCRDVRIEDCAFLGDAGGSAKAEAIQLDVSTHVGSSTKSLDSATSYDGLPTRSVTVRRCRFEAVGSARMPNPLGCHTVALDGDPGWYEDVLFEANRCIGWTDQDATAHGWLHFFGIRRLTVRSNLFHFTGTSGSTGHSSVIHVHSATQGTALADVALASPPLTVFSEARGLHDIVIEQNVFQGHAASGSLASGALISLIADGGTLRGVRCSGNRIDGASAGVVRCIAPAGSAASNRVVVTDNELRANGSREAVLIANAQAVVSGNAIAPGSNYGLFLNATFGSSVTGNTFTGGTRAIRVSGDRASVVEANRLRGFTDWGIAVSHDGDTEPSEATLVAGNVLVSDGTSAPSQGIRIGSKSTRAKVFGNLVLTGAVSNLGTGTSMDATNTAA